MRSKTNLSPYYLYSLSYLHLLCAYNDAITYDLITINYHSQIFSYLFAFDYNLSITKINPVQLTPKHKVTSIINHHFYDGSIKFKISNYEI